MYNDKDYEHTAATYLRFNRDPILDRVEIEEDRRRRFNSWSIFIGIAILLSTIVFLVTY